MAILLLAAAALVPLAIAPGLLLFYDVTPKVVVLLAATSGAAIWFAVSPQAGAFPREARWFAALLGLQLVSLIASTALSDRVDLSIAGTNWRRFGLVTQSALLGYTLLVVLALSARPALVQWMLRAMAAAGTLAAIYGIAQYFGFDPLLDPAGYRVGEGVWMIVRPPSTLGHANYAGVVYLLAVFAGAAILAQSRALGWTAVLLGTAAIVLGGSRAALLGLLAGAVTLAVAHGWRPRRKHAIAAAGALACFAIFYLTPPGERLRARVRWFVEDPRGGARLMLWKGTLAMALERPVAGWGPETFSGAFAKFRPEDLAAAYPDFYDESAHNVFLDTLAAQGVPGLLLLAGLCAVAFRAAPPPLAAILVALLVALQFSGFTVPTALCLYTTAALACGAGTRPAASLPIGRLRWLLLLPAVAWLVFAAALGLWDIRLKQVDRLLAANDLDAAASAWQAATRVQPHGTSSDLWYSRRLLSIAQTSPHIVTRGAALRHASAAGQRATIAAEDRQNAWYHLATLHALGGDAALTQTALRNAMDAAPRWFKPRWTLARLLLLTGKRDEAAQEAAAAVKLSGGKLPEVNATLEEALRPANQK